MKISSPDWQATGCAGKQAFEAKSLATKIAKLSSGRRSTPMSAYKCEFCGKYHVGSRNAKPPSYNKRPKMYLTEADDELL